MFSINIVNAETMSIFNIPNVNKEFSQTYKDNILSEFKAIDNTDRITTIEIVMDNSFTNNTGIFVNLSNNFTYALVVDKFSFLGINTFMNVNQTYNYQNYTYFSDSKTTANYLNNKIRVIIDYNTNTRQTTIKEQHASGLTYNFVYDTENYIGMPASDIKITGLSKYDVTITVKDIGSSLTLNKQKLSLFSGILYGILTFKFTVPLTSLSIGFGENETLLNFFLLIDLFFWYLSLFFVILFTYPQLLIVWLITIGNIFIAYKSNSIREIVFNVNVYYTYIGNKAYQLGKFLIEIVIRIVTAITNMIP